MDIARQEFSVCAPERNSVRVLHSNSLLHRETFVANFAPSRLGDLATSYLYEVKRLNIKVQAAGGSLSELPQLSFKWEQLLVSAFSESPVNTRSLFRTKPEKSACPGPTTLCVLGVS
jgi:hypothetical protein